MSLDFPSCTCHRELPIWVLDESQYRINLPPGLGKYRIGGVSHSFLYCIKSLLLFFLPTKGSTFPSEVIYGFQQLLQMSAKDAEVVDYSTKAFCIL